MAPWEALLGAASIWSTATAFNFYGSYDQQAIIGSLGISSSCLSAMYVEEEEEKKKKGSLFIRKLCLLVLGINLLIVIPSIPRGLPKAWTMIV